MFIDSKTGKMVNIYAPFGGFSRLDMAEIRARAGVVEIADDPAPEDYSDDTYFRTEDWSATQRPYVTYTRKSDEQIAEVKLQRAKAERTAAVEAIKVTTTSGKEFDGDETSQGRMSRAILAGQIAGITSCTWVLANNVPTTVTLAELSEALSLAMQAQGAIWAEPYL